MAMLRKLLVAAILLASAQAMALKVETGNPDITFNITAQLQVRYSADWDGYDYNLASPNGHLNHEFSVRRARLITSGEAYKMFTYYIMLDTPRFGQRGNYTGSTFVQDLYVGYKPLPDFNIEAGFLYMPLSHATLASNSQTNALEGPSDILFYTNARGLREGGVQIRGLILDKRILIRGGVYNGARQIAPPAGTTPPVNPNGSPQAAGILRFNLAGEETGYSYPGIYMDGKTRISVGVGAQYQQKSGARQGTSANYNDYMALSADMFADVALGGEQEAVLQVGLYRFDYGTGAATTGNAIHVETGYRFGNIEPQFNMVWFNSDPKTSSILRLSGGVNYYFKGHNAKLQAEFGHQKFGSNTTPGLILDTTNAQHYFILQAQAAF